MSRQLRCRLLGYYTIYKSTHVGTDIKAQKTRSTKIRQQVYEFKYPTAGTENGSFTRTEAQKYIVRGEHNGIGK
jgi:hypothetical protein